MTWKTRYIKLLLKFRYAFRGLAIAFKTQSSFRIHIITAAIVYILGIVFALTGTQWALINAAILFVIVTELVNTAIEHLCDFVHPRHHKAMKIIKDISAGAVLIAVLNALITGFIIFTPLILSLF